MDHMDDRPLGLVPDLQKSLQDYVIDFLIGGKSVASHRFAYLA